MSELDPTDLEAVRAWAQRRVDRRERQERMAPLHEAISKRIGMMSDFSAGIMAGPTAEVRRSILAMEKSDAEWPEKRQEMEARLEGQLARVRRRTDALRTWLEALS